MKKIPYALTLLVAYIVMTYQKFPAAFGENGSVAAIAIAVIPVVLAVLLIVNMKKDVSQIAAIFCLALGALYLYTACDLFATMMGMVRAEEAPEYVALSMLPGLIHAGLGGLIAWFVGAHIQDDEVSGGYKFLAFVAIIGQLFFTFTPSVTGSGNASLSVIGNLVMMLVYWHLPNAFVNYATCKKTKVIHLIVLVVLTVACVAGQELLTKFL